MKITDALRKYRGKKADVEATLKRIEAWEKALKSNNISQYIVCNKQSIELGMPRAHSTTSPVEAQVFAKIQNIKLTREMLREWISEDKSRIYFQQQEIEQIDAAMGALSVEDRYIVERKYMDKTCWMFVEISYFEQFRQDLKEDALRKRASEALGVLNKILKSYYDKFRGS